MVVDGLLPRGPSPSTSSRLARLREKGLPNNPQKNFQSFPLYFFPTILLCSLFTEYHYRGMRSLSIVV